MPRGRIQRCVLLLYKLIKTSRPREKSAKVAKQVLGGGDVDQKFLPTSFIKMCKMCFLPTSFIEMCLFSGVQRFVSFDHLNKKYSTTISNKQFSKNEYQFMICCYIWMCLALLIYSLQKDTFVNKDFYIHLIQLLFESLAVKLLGQLWRLEESRHLGFVRLA